MDFSMLLEIMKTNTSPIISIIMIAVYIMGQILYKKIVKTKDKKHKIVTSTEIVVRLNQIAEETEIYTKEIDFIRFIEERKTQMSFVQLQIDGWKAQMEQKLYTAKKEYRKTQKGMDEEQAIQNIKDESMDLMVSAFDNINEPLCDYFRKLFTNNGLANKKTNSNGTKDSEFEVYIKKHKLKITNYTNNLLSTRLMNLSEPDWNYLYNQFLYPIAYKELEEITELCIVHGREVSLEMKEKLQSLKDKIKQVRDEHYNAILGEEKNDENN